MSRFMKWLFIQQLAILSVLFVLGCSGGGGGGGAPGAPQNPSEPDPNAVITDCDHVVTEASVRKFNQQQNEYRVRAAGLNSYCEAELNENGVIRKTKKTGMTNVEIIPRWQAKSMTVLTNNGNSSERFIRIVIKTEEFENLTDQKKNEILSALGVKKSNQEQFVFANSSGSFVLVRLGAMLLPITSFDFFSSDDKTYNKRVTLQLPISTGTFVEQLVKDINDGNLVADFILLEGATINSNQIKFGADQFSPWQSENSIQSLKKHASLRDRGLGQYAVTSSIRYVLSWAGLKIQDVHAAIPELYSWAERFVQNEPISPTSSDEYLLYLRYLTKISPQHEKAELYLLSTRLNRYVQTSYESLSTANSWLREKTYSKDQIDFILGGLELLTQNISGLNLQDGLDLAQELEWNIERREFFVSVVAGLKQLQLYSGRELLRESKLRLQRGLTKQNIQGYWQAVEIFKSYAATNFGPTLKKMIEFADQWFLEQKISIDEIRLRTELASWVRERAFGDAFENLNRVKELAQIASVNEAQIRSYKSMFEYLNSSLYFTSKDSLIEMQELHRLFQLRESSLNMMRELSKYFSGTLSINNKDAYFKAKSFVQNGIVDSVLIDQLKTHVKWLMDIMNVSNKDALNRTESLLFKEKLSERDLELIRASVKWLVSDLSLNNKEALAKGESYVVQSKMDSVKFQLLQSEYLNGYKKHSNFRKALADAEKLVLGRE